ncbi:MAG: phosphate ABC transporter substrate-binding protein [Pirellulales bacterium]|nr:phosphate ABC transporter substrate-binding protein [Pirellulales bacterium]
MWKSFRNCSRVTVVLSALAVLGVQVPAGGKEEAVDRAIKPYVKVSGISGNLNSIGSDTLLNLMTYWAEAFQKAYPNVKIQIKGEGSATAPPALTKGTAQLGPMSRAMKNEELDAFEKKHGFKPTRVTVALDCLAVFVNKDNPVKGLNLQQLDGIFSQTHKSGAPDITTWGQVGLKGSWALLPMSLYGRNSVSGTYAFFKEHALLKGDYKDAVKEQPGSAAVVNAVANDRGAIGYSGIGYKTADVRVVSLAQKAGQPFEEASFANALAGKYPLGRALYVYVAKKPGRPLPPHVKEFLKFVLSREGQQIVVKDGFGALPPKTLAKQLNLLE